MHSRNSQFGRMSFRRFTGRLMEWKIGHPKTALAAIAIVTLALAWSIPRLTVRTSIYDMVIETLPANATYRAFQDMFGSDDIIRVVIKGEQVFDDFFFEKVARIAAEAKKIDGVHRVISLPGIKAELDPHDRWSLEKFKQICKPVALFRKNLLSEDDRTTAITLVLGGQTDAGRVIDDLRELLARSGRELALYQIGIPLVSRALADYTTADLKRILPITLALIAGLLFLIYRNVWLVALPAICVLLALCWTFGLMAWLKVSLTMLTLIVPVFIVAVGTAYCLHLCSAYMAHCRRKNRSDTAVLDAFTEMYLPTILAVLTTAAGLGSLLINRITAIREFALFAGVGILSLLVVILWVLPAAFALIPARQFLRHPPPLFANLTDRFLELIIHINLKHQRSAFIALGAVTLIAAGGIFFVKVETNPVAYFKTSTEVSQNFHDIYRDLSGSFPLQVVLKGSEEDIFETVEALEHLEAVQQFLETLPKVDKAVSFATYMKLVNYVSSRYDPQRYALPEESFEVRMLINEYKTILGQDMLTPFMDDTYSSVNILLLTHLSSSREFLHTRKMIQEWADEHLPDEFRLTVTGIGVVMSESSHHLVTGQLKSLFLTVAILFSIMLMLFLSGRVGAVAILTNFFPIIVTFGTMGWFGIELNMATGLIASIAIGLAVDDTIHYLTRYSREFKKDLDKDRALAATVAGVGRPIVFSTLTLGVGFSVLLFSHFVPTAVFGLLMVVTLLAALVGDLILLPSLMLHIELITAWDLLRLMPSVSGVSPGVAHELNQPLNAIKMGSEYLKIMLQQGKKIGPDQLSDAVYEIGAQVDRASEIINRLRVFGDKPAFAREPVDINQPLRDTAAVLRHQLRLEDITLELDLSSDLPPVQAHHHRLGQVFYNLIVNSSEAIINRPPNDREGSSIIRIRTVFENGQVAATIEDTGRGIPPDMRERVFEPFFTTKEAGKGKGLGLSISHEIIRDYGGTIAILDRKPTGTLVRLSFPVKKFQRA